MSMISSFHFYCVKIPAAAMLTQLSCSFSNDDFNTILLIESVDEYPSDELIKIIPKHLMFLAFTKIFIS